MEATAKFLFVVFRESDDAAAEERVDAILCRSERREGSVVILRLWARTSEVNADMCGIFATQTTACAKPSSLRDERKFDCSQLQSSGLCSCTFIYIVSN